MASLCCPSAGTAGIYGSMPDRSAFPFGKRPPETAELLVAREPLAPVFPVLHHPPTRFARHQQLVPAFRCVSIARWGTIRFANTGFARKEWQLHHCDMVKRQHRNLVEELT